MIRERPSSRELCLPLADFKRFGFRRACKLASVPLPPKKEKAE